MSSNLELWDSLEQTDPKWTKQFTRAGGFSGTAINGTYIVKMLTQAFGPCGKGWVFVVDGEDYITGHTLKSGDSAQLHVIRGHIRYYRDGQWYDCSPQFGQTMLVSENKYGTFMDEDAPKKSITDCISKCAVQLGIGADVHLGLFDDNKYVAERRAESSPPAPSKKTDTPVDDPRRAKAIKWGEDAIKHLATIKAVKDFDAWHTPDTRAKVAAIKAYDATLHAAILAAIDKVLEKTNPIGA